MKKNNIPDLDNLTDEEMLKLRFCDLPIKIEGTWIQNCIKELHKELTEKKINFKPKCYLTDEWLCPDDEPIIGIPFYLAHPRLKKLEHRIMLEAEGGDKVSCMKLLRHEMGHVINYSYKLHRRKKWKELFGSFKVEYPDRYKYKPYSRRYVIHLEEWYAQYHPDEDFAETFAVWLSPNSNWKERYKGWQALRKLNYVDLLMKDISDKKPIKPVGKKYWDIKNMKTRLETYYRRKKDFFAENYSDFHDVYLKKILTLDNPDKNSEKVYKVLRKYRKEIITDVALCTGEKKYRIDGLLKKIIERCKEIGFKFAGSEKEIILKVSVYVTAQIMNFMYTGRFKKKR